MPAAGAAGHAQVDLCRIDGPIRSPGGSRRRDAARGTSLRGTVAEDPGAGAAGREQAAPVIVIDPGHGGVDPGAVGGQRSLEKDVVLAVARQLRDASWPPAGATTCT